MINGSVRSVQSAVSSTDSVKCIDVHKVHVLPANPVIVY